jgi:hypothetical protein
LALPVYVFRKHTSSAGRIGIEVYCDGVSFGQVQGGVYFTHELSPGKHTFISTDKRFLVEIDAVNGGVYYIEFSLLQRPVGLGSRAVVRIAQVSNQVGEAEIKGLKPR